MKGKKAKREDAVQSSRRKRRMVWPGVLTAKLMRTGGSGLDFGEAEPTGCSERFIAGESRMSPILDSYISLWG